MDAGRAEGAGMKRIVAIGAVVVVLLAAGWSLFWWLGRDALARAFDAEVARLEASGWTVDWADRRIGGFPFGYTIRLTGLEAAEPASGFAVRLPHATVENDGADGVLIRLPETFAADLPLAAPRSADAPQKPATAATTAEARALVVRLAGAGAQSAGAERRVGVEAQSLTWRLQMPDSPREQVLTLEGLAADMVSGGAETTLALKAARYGVEAALAEGDGRPSTMTASYRDVSLTGDTTVPTPGALAEMLYAGAPGQFELAVQAGPAEAHLVGGEDEQRGTLDWQAGAISGIATLSSGRIELQGEARQNFWTLTPDAPDAPFRGRVGAEALAATYAMPMAPAGQPDDMAIKLSLAEVTLDDTAWAAIDPNGALPRQPAKLNVDLGGRARVTRRIDGLSPGDAPPFEVSQLDINEIALDALGAAARATGSIEFLQPIGLPLGTLEVSMTGASALIGALGRAGVLTAEQVEMADAMLTVYARPAEGKDQWETDITFTNDGPQVNGQPIR
jgi:hypothetical protein